MTLFHLLPNHPSFPFIAVGIVCITWYIDVRTDFARWDKGTVNHVRGAWLRLLGFVPTTLLDWHSVLLWLPYWPLFDGVLGVWKREQWRQRNGIAYCPFGWFYLGTTSRLDRMQHKYKWLVGVKYGLAGAALIIYLTFKF